MLVATVDMHLSIYLSISFYQVFPHTQPHAYIHTYIYKYIHTYIHGNKHFTCSGKVPMCPGRESVQKKCPQKISRSLLALLFRNHCCLCDTKYTTTTSSLSSSSSSPAITVECALEHTFCAPCLYQDITTTLRLGQHAKCPRAAECRYTYEESDVRVALTGMGDPTQHQQIIEDRVMDWYDIRSGRVMEKHPGMKHCPVANCPGEMMDG